MLCLYQPTHRSHPEKRQDDRRRGDDRAGRAHADRNRGSRHLQILSAPRLPGILHAGRVGIFSSAARSSGRLRVECPGEAGCIGRVRGNLLAHEYGIAILLPSIMDDHWMAKLKLRSARGRSAEAERRETVRQGLANVAAALDAQREWQV